MLVLSFHTSIFGDCLEGLLESFFQRIFNGVNFRVIDVCSFDRSFNCSFDCSLDCSF